MQKFCKGEDGGVRTWVFFKRGGGSCKQCQGEHWKITFKFGNCKGGDIDTRG